VGMPTGGKKKNGVRNGSRSKNGPLSPKNGRQLPQFAAWVMPTRKKALKRPLKNRSFFWTGVVKLDSLKSKARKILVENGGKRKKKKLTNVIWRRKNKRGKVLQCQSTWRERDL